jgi:hypothetical protein
MVKGVSKTVIVVNNTGSKLFEKIVFYVTPEYGNLNAKQLRKAASEFSFNYDYSPAKSLRKRYKRKLNIKLLSILGLGLAILTAALILIL